MIATVYVMQAVTQHTSHFPRVFSNEATNPSPFWRTGETSVPMCTCVCTGDEGRGEGTTARLTVTLVSSPIRRG